MSHVSEAPPPAPFAGLPPEGGIVHATTVSLGARALLIAGPSGSGKSGLALRLMALGAGLVADDRTHLAPQPDGPPIASAPPALRGMIEARGLGILSVRPAPPAIVIAVLDLGRTETERLPPRRVLSLCGAEVAWLHNHESPYFPEALLQYLSEGRSDT